MPKGLYLSPADPHGCLWLQGRGVTCGQGAQKGLGARCCPCTKGQTRGLREGGREGACAAPGSLGHQQFVLQSQCFLKFGPSLTCPSPPCHALLRRVQLPELTGTEAAVWCPWGCLPLQAEPALVLQLLCTGKCSSHNRVGVSPLSSLLWFINVANWWQAPDWTQWSNGCWVEARKSCSLSYWPSFCLYKMWLPLLSTISSFISKPLVNNVFVWKCSEDTWFTCSKHSIKTIGVVHHLPPHHYLYLLRKNITVTVTYILSTTPLFKIFVSLRLFEFCEDVARKLSYSLSYWKYQ